MSPDEVPPGPRRERLADLRRELAAVGFHPSRRLGQNFLLDPGLHDAICREAGVAEGDRVIEIGVGMGFLTRALLERGARVLGFEVDERLIPVARRLLGEPDALELVHADALAGKHLLAERLERALSQEGPWSVVANLPYSASGPLLALFAELAGPPDPVTVLVQHELALRLAASPGGDAWGPLTARVQSAYSPHLARTVPATSFWPRPKVESAIVRLDLRPDLADVESRRLLSRAVGLLMPRRRQTIRRVLADLLHDRPRAEAELARLGIEPDRRVERLTGPELGDLGAVLEGGREGVGGGTEP